MAIVDRPSFNPEAMEAEYLVEDYPGVDVGLALSQMYDGATIEDWDALVGVVVHKSDQQTPIGGFLRVEVSLGDGAKKSFDVDDQHRPLPESAITVLGALAEFNAEGIKEDDPQPAYMSPGKSKKYARGVIRILCR